MLFLAACPMEFVAMEILGTFTKYAKGGQYIPFIADVHKALLGSTLDVYYGHNRSPGPTGKLGWKVRNTPIHADRQRKSNPLKVLRGVVQYAWH